MAEIPPNIEAFNRVVLFVLTGLYEVFPNKRNLSSGHHGPESLEGMPDDEGEVPDRDMKPAVIFEATVDWLQSEGFISVSERGNMGNFDGVRLTLKGLALMGTPESVKGPSKTLYQQSKDALAEGSKKGATDIVASLMGLAWNMGLRAVTGPGMGP